MEGGYFMEEDVLGLDVTMDDVTVVHELDDMADLLDNPAHFLLSEPSLIAEAGVDVSAAAELEHEVEVFLIGEVGVELHDVGVVEVALDLDLADQLVYVLLGLEYLLGDLLERTQEAGGYVPAEVDRSELSLLYVLPDLEILNADALRSALLAVLPAALPDALLRGLRIHALDLVNGAQEGSRGAGDGSGHLEDVLGFGLGRAGFFGEGRLYAIFSHY